MNITVNKEKIDGRYDVNCNSHNIGYCYMEVDGYYVFVWNHDRRGGFVEALTLKQIAQILDDLNAKWDAEVQAYFSKV